MKDSLKHKIWQYLLNTIAKPRKELGNFPVCPFVKQYRNEILVVKSNNYVNTINNFAVFKDQFDLEAVVVYGFDENADTVLQVLESINKKLKNKDVFCLYMDPDFEDPPLPVDYEWHDCPLIIIQRLSTLKKHRKQLKKTDYYSYYSDSTK